MSGLRVGVEVQAPQAVVALAAGTLPWMSPERIVLHDERTLVLFSTSLRTPGEACAYVTRRLRKSISGLDLDLEILSVEVFPGTVAAFGHGRTTSP